MRRVIELVNTVRSAHPGDAFFRDFEASLAFNPLKQRYYEAYERAFSCLDQTSWNNLRGKAVAHFPEFRTHQRKAPFFAQLNDAFAYRWLKNRGFLNVTVLPEASPSRKKHTTPDLSFCSRNGNYACEVKTLNVSDLELKRRTAAPKYYDRSMYKTLGQGLFDKIDDTVARGFEQVHAYAKHGLVFLILHEDDFTATFSEHRAQIAVHLRKASAAVVVKFGIHGRRRIEHLSSLYRDARGSTT